LVKCCNSASHIKAATSASIAEYKITEEKGLTTATAAAAAAAATTTTTTTSTPTNTLTKKRGKKQSHQQE